MSKIQPHFSLFQVLKAIISQTRDFIKSNYDKLAKIGLFFLLGLSVLCLGTLRTADSSSHNEQWKQQASALLTAEETHACAEQLLNACQTQNMSVIQDLCSSSVAPQLITNEEEKESLRAAIINMFGGGDVLSETALSDIDTFITELYQSEISSYEITDIHVKDNQGRASVTLHKRTSPTVVCEYELGEIASKATSEYSEAHRQELIQMYLDSNDETMLTRIVIDNIYPQILEYLKDCYQKEYVEETDIVLIIEKGKENNCIVTELVYPDKKQESRTF